MSQQTVLNLSCLGQRGAWIKLSREIAVAASYAVNIDELDLLYQDMQEHNLIEYHILENVVQVRLSGKAWRAIEVDASRPGMTAKAREEPLQIFISYSHRDEEFRLSLTSHLSILEREKMIAGWHDRKLLPGQEWAEAIDENLETADIILLLISADFISSEYCWGRELRRAMERHEEGTARVVPVIVRDCDWHSAPFGKLQALPTDGKPVASWENQDEAFADVARGLRRLVQELRGV